MEKQSAYEKFIWIHPNSKTRGLLWYPSDMNLNSNPLNRFVFHKCHTKLPWQGINELLKLRLLKNFIFETTEERNTILLVDQAFGAANIDFEIHCHSENLV